MRTEPVPSGSTTGLPGAIHESIDGARELEIEVDGRLEPSSAWHELFWAGRAAGRDDVRYTGWGSREDHLTVRQAEVFAAPPGAGLELLLLGPAAAIDASLGRLPAAQSAIVHGEWPLGPIVEHCLAWRRTSIRSESSLGATPRGDVDLLVDISGQADGWLPLVDRVATGGSVLLYLPPWARPIDLNLYPSIHRRSLHLTARRWHVLPEDLAEIDRHRLDAITNVVLRSRPSDDRARLSLPRDDAVQPVTAWRFLE